MKVRRGRKAVSVVFVASIAASSIAVLVPDMSAQAAAPTLTIPGRVYPEPGQILNFSGNDPISGDNRAIVIDGLEPGPLGCAPDAGNGFEIDDCPGVDLELSGEAGLLRMSGIEGINNDPDPENDLLFNADEGVVVTATDSQNGRDSRIFTLRGPAAGVLNMLATLQLVPCSEQIGTDIVPAPPAGDNPYSVDCGGPGGHPDDEPLYEERESEDGQLPNLFVRAIQGDSSVNPTGNIYFKFESTNEGPDVNAPASAIDAPAGATTDVDGQVDVVDDDMCNQLLCGAPYTENPGMAEGDDEMLLVAWIPESNCGTFNFIVSAALTNLGGGGSTRTSVHDVLRAWTGLDLNDTEQDVAADAIAAAVELNLVPNAVALDLSSQPSSIGSPTTVFAGTGQIDDVRWALDNIDYTAPADDATCHLNIQVSDLGNNGKPLSYIGSPFGPETPHTGHTLPDDGDPGTPLEAGDDEPYEVPNALADVTSLTFNVEDSHPDVTISQIAPSQAGDPAGPNKPSGFKITFSAAVEGFTESDLTLQNSDASGAAFVPLSFTSLPGNVYTVVVDADDDGTITVEMTGEAFAVGHSGDSAYANDPPVYDDNEIEWDQSGPTVTIDKKDTQADPTNTSPVLFTVEFGDTVTSGLVDFTKDDVVVSGTANPNPNLTVVTQPDPLDLKTFQVAVAGMTGPGTVIATVPAGAVVDTALNGSQASTSTDNVVGFDNDGPDVTIDQAAGQLDPTIGSPIMFDVQFSESVTDFATGDVTLGGTALPSAATVTGSGMNYTVAVSGMTMDGTVAVSIAAGVAHDVAENPNSASTSGDDTVTFDFDEGDVTAPTVTIDQNAAQAETTSTVPIVYDVVFSEPVVDFATGDVTLSGTAGATTAVVTGSGSNYTVSVSGMAQDGTVIASIDAARAHDIAANANLASTSTDNTVTWVQADVTAPTVTVNQAAGQTDPADVSPILFTVVFSEPVSDFETGDVTLAGTAGATTGTVTGSGTTYTVSVSGMVSPGTVIASIIGGVAHDASTNPNAASTSADNNVTWSPDVTPPTVTIDQAGGQPDPTTATPILFTVTFSENVSGFDTGDVTLSGSAAATTALVSGAGKDYTVAVTGMTQDGTVTASLNAGVAQDAASNPSNASTSTDNSVTFEFDEADTSQPTVTIDQAGGQVDPTSTSPIMFTVLFSEPVVGFATGDVTVGGTAGATTGGVTGSGDTYTVSVSNMLSSGTVTVTIPAGVAKDAANNDNLAASSTDASVTYDPIAPTVTITKKTGQADPTNASPVMFTVTFSESITGFVTGDVTLSGSGNATTATVTPVSASEYDVAVTGMSGEGTVIADVLASKAIDLAGNANTAAPASAQVTFDNLAPMVAIDQAGGQADPTSAPSINFTVVFSESVSDFVTGDVTIGGTAGATAADVTGSGTTYTVAVSGMTGSGTVIASIAAGVAHDAVGNANGASTAADNQVQFNVPPDSTAPTVTIDQAAAQADPSTAPSVVFTVVFSEAVGGFTPSDIALGGTAGATTAVISGVGPTYTVTVTGMTTSGTVIASIPAGVVADAALNANTASTSTDSTVTFTQPTIAVSTAGGTVHVTVVSGGVLTAASAASPQVPPPNGVAFPFGQLSFTASSTPGGVVVFQLTLPSPVTTYDKLVSGAWQEFTFDGETGVQVNGNILTVTIRDNGRGDSDLTSGVVTDPGAPAVLAQVPPTTPTTTTAPTTSPTTTPGALPPTGSSSTNNLTVAAALLIGFGFLLAGARRRQSSKASA
jgi:large repetitive protein